MYQRVFESFEHASKDHQSNLDAVVTRADKLQLDLDAKKEAKVETDKELANLRLKAEKLQEAENEKDELEPALKAAKEEAIPAIENAKSNVGRLAVTDFKKSEDFVGLLGERYDGGWVDAKRCVCHTHPTLDWEQMAIVFAEATHTRPLDGELFICSEDVITNLLTATADEEAPPS